MIQNIITAVVIRVLEWLGKLLAREIRKGNEKKARAKADEKLLAKVKIAETNKERIDSAKNILRGL